MVVLRGNRDRTAGPIPWGPDICPRRAIAETIAYIRITSVVNTGRLQLSSSLWNEHAFTG
jgi:hypothetical protein